MAKESEETVSPQGVKAGGWEWIGARWEARGVRQQKDKGTKIIDIHCHIFPPLGRSEGWDPQVHTKMAQYHSRDFSKFWRKSDGAPVDEPLLDFDSDDVNHMPDLNFRMGKYGIAEITKDGVDYYMQWYPPNLADMESTAERIVGEMDAAGVDVGVLQSDHVYGSLNAYYAEHAKRFPGRFVPLAQVREWNADEESELERLERAVLEQGCNGLYFSVEPFMFNGWADRLDDAKFEPMWELVKKLKISVFWYIDCRRRDREAAFMERIAELARWTDRHPDIPNVITHSIAPIKILHSEGFPDEAIALLKRPNTHVEMRNPAHYPDYPYVDGQEALKRLCDLVGVEKMLWGSDMPYSSGFWCTYMQAVDHIGMHCDFLSPEERSLILGGNAARVLGLQ